VIIINNISFFARQSPLFSILASRCEKVNGTVKKPFALPGRMCYNR